MDPSRRQEIRQARRQRRARGNAAAANDGRGGGAHRLSDGAAFRTQPQESAAVVQQQQQQQQPPPPMEESAGGGGGGGAHLSRGGSRGRRGGVAGAARLAEKMERRRAAASRRREAFSEREVLLQSRYAPRVMEVFEEQQAHGHQSPQRAWSAAALQETTDFNKDGLVAELITRSRATFLSLDKELSDDHALATQRLHSSVFAHANDFLLLFHDIEKAGGLVEALKANVQAVKVAISTISKFTYSNVGNSSARAASAGSAGVFGDSTASEVGATATGGSGHAVMSRVRPSLVSRRACSGNGGEDGGVEGLLARPESSSMNRVLGGNTGKGRYLYGADGYSFSSDRGDGAAAAPPQVSVGPVVGTSSPSASAAGTTTHALNVPSVFCWRYTVGRNSPYSSEESTAERAAASAGDGGGSAEKPTSAANTTGMGGRGSTTTTAAAAAASAAAAAVAQRAKELRDIQMLADILKEETSQLLAERKALDAAELLRGVSEEAVARGCLPLLLDLEASLVTAVLGSLLYIPITPMYMETMHIPLMQLLMSLGRVRSGSAAYLDLQTTWLRGELRKLQSRVNPTHASLVTVDFLVTAMRDILKRQHTLSMSLEDARKVLAAEEAAEAAGASSQPRDGGAVKTGRRAVGGAEEGATTTTTTATTAEEEVKRRANGGGAAPVVDKAALVPPNSAALLWVRDNVEFLAGGILSTHMLSYGTGIDGGDPSRIRRAMAMLAETLRVLGVMTAEGFAGCDTHILRQLTPSLIVLQSEFTKLTETRMENSGRAMVEQLITNTFRLYGKGGLRLYTPSSCGDVARKNNLRCQELLKSLKACLPCCSHSWLVQLLLCPAAASMFERDSVHLLASKRFATGKDGSAAKRSVATANSAAAAATDDTDASLLPLNGYRFLRYANGCTSVHNVLIQSLARFTAAMVGREWCHGGGGDPSAPTTSGDGRGESSGVDRKTPTTRADVAVAPAKEGTREPTESAEFLLLSNALLMESYDVTMTRLLRALLSTELRERQALINYLSSEEYERRHKKRFPPPSPAKERAPSQKPPLLGDPSSSPGWVLDGMSGLLCDVISAGVWTSYFAEGGAVSHITEVAGLMYRPRHLEQLRRAMPRVVQGWLTATLVLAHNAGQAKGLLRGARQQQQQQQQQQRQRQGPEQSSVRATGSPLPFGNGGDGRGGHRQEASHGGSPVTLLGAGRDGGEGCAEGFAANGAAVTRGGLVSVPVVIFGGDGDGDGGLLGDPHSGGGSVVVRGGTSGPDGGAADPLPEADVEEDRLLPLLMAILDRKFAFKKGYCCHTMLAAAGCVASPELASQAFASTSPTSRSASRAGGPSASLVWSVRSVVPSYPEFPIGGGFDRTDELFLFHWCAQISLQLLALFQERLLTPSFVLNARAADRHSGNSSGSNSGGIREQSARGDGAADGSPAAVLGCVSPAEDSVLASLCAGGGSYVAAVSLLQFLVVRLLRDALCRPSTWCAVYNCEAVEGWRGDANCVKQQLFFFSAFLRLWSPLFCGGTGLPVAANGGETAADQRRRASGGGSGASSLTAFPLTDTKVSATNVDGVPSLAVLEWLSTGGVLQPRVSAPAGTGAADGSVGRTTAIDALFGGSASAAEPAAAPATHGGERKGWKAGGGLHGGVPVGGKAAARRALFGGGSSYVPDTLLRVVQRFFEVDLGEAAAVSTITSDLMRKRVDRAMTSINLLDFVGTSLGSSSSSDDDEEDTASSRASSADAAVSGKVTLNDVRELLLHYLRPLH